MQSRFSTTRKSDFVHANGIRLHYLDWGGEGPALLFLAGMGCTAYIYSRLAPHFTDHFHVIALTRRGHGDSDYPETGYEPDTLVEDIRQFMDALGIEQAILVGHSLAGIELSHFAVRYPERTLKLVYLDAAYDRTYPAYKAIMEKNPLRNIQPPETDKEADTIQAYVATLKRVHPDLAAIWDELLDEEVLHTITKNSAGKVVDKMPQAIGEALNDVLYSFTPEDAKLQSPVLSIYTILDSSYYLAPGYMTAEQQAQVVEFIDVLRAPIQKECFELFRHRVPHARIVIIPKGHHYCFIKHEALVVEEMRRFLPA